MTNVAVQTFVMLPIWNTLSRGRRLARTSVQHTARAGDHVIAVRDRE
jgi:hypothetical protein